MESANTLIERAMKARQMSAKFELQIERLGSAGVEVLRRAVTRDDLTDDQKIRVLRLMGLISREQYPRGKLAVLEAASLLVRDPAMAVRSAAIDSAINAYRAIHEIAQCADLRDRARPLLSDTLSFALSSELSEATQSRVTHFRLVHGL